MWTGQRDGQLCHVDWTERQRDTTELTVDLRNFLNLPKTPVRTSKRTQ